MGFTFLHACLFNDHWHIEHGRIFSFLWYMSRGWLCYGRMVCVKRECIRTCTVRTFDGDLDVVRQSRQGAGNNEPIHYAHL